MSDDMNYSFDFNIYTYFPLGCLMSKIPLQLHPQNVLQSKTNLQIIFDILKLKTIEYLIPLFISNSENIKSRPPTFCYNFLQFKTV